MATHTGIDAQAGQDSPEPALVKRWFTKAGLNPLDQITWTRRDVWVGTKYEHLNVEAPDFWSDNAVAITSKLYLSKAEGSREHSVRQLVERVAAKIVVEAMRHGYLGGDYTDVGEVFLDPVDSHERRLTIITRFMLDEPPLIFFDELCYVMANQIAIFNSPVLFNVGRDDRPQAVSACYILGVDDTTTSIMETVRREAFIFKGGSGAGYSVSNLRGSMEELSTGGWASGPVSFMRLWDANAGTFKSGGTTRRAAKLVKCDVDHPDIRDFITCKVREEERIEALIEAGVNLSFSDAEGERNLAEATSFQNANNSVGATDEFMRRAVSHRKLDGTCSTDWPLIARKNDAVVAIDDAVDLLDLIAQSAHACACPGMMWMDAMNRMHTTPMIDGEASPVNATNPCFPGETLVDTSEGRIRIDELAGMYAQGLPLPYAFGFDRDAALPALKRIRQATMTKMITELVEVETDKGVVFRCTPEHEVLTRHHGRSSTGDYVAAQDLQIGQRLRKVGRWVNEQRSGRRYLNHAATEAVPNGTSCQAPWMWEQVYGPIPEGMEIHHRNEQPWDDRISNFELVDSGSHQAFHSGGERNGRYIDVPDQTIVEVFEAMEAERGQPTPAKWNRYIDDHGLNGVVPKANSQRGVRGMPWEEFVLWVEDHKVLVNDTVKSVRHIYLDEAVPVYDISVEDTHNFSVVTPDVEHGIVVSNCGEYVSNDDTSCNLGSLNVLKFVRDDGSFEVESFRHVVDLMATSMDVLVSLADFPDEIIGDRTRKLRQLGLGYSNMGAAIMAQGLAYDSDAGRDFAASVTALETGRVYRRSAQLARQLAPFHYYEENREAMLAVLRKHANALPGDGGGDVWSAADMDWLEALSIGSLHGFRNAQATVIPPAGTTSYFLDCDTTGIEPAFLLTIHKEMAGGGTMTIENMSVHRALHKIGLDPYAKILREQGIDEFMQALPEKYRAIFHGANDISAEGHIKMMAAVQPFVSGAISKTINMPGDATWQDVRDAYALAWRLGCKDLAIYRDGSKARQPHAAVKKTELKTKDLSYDVSADLIDEHGTIKGVEMPMSVIWPEGSVERCADADYVTPERRLLPRTRRSITHKIHLRGPMGDYKGYVHAGMYDDGRLAEIFIDGFGRAGSFTLNALARWGTAYSKAIQYGIPWEDFARDSLGVADETGGMVVPEPGRSDAPPIRSAKSVFDYIVRWLALEFGDDDLRAEFGVHVVERRRPEDVSSESVRLDAADVEWSTVTLHATTAIVGDQMIDLDDVKAKVFIDDDGNVEFGVTRAPVLGPICGGCGGHMRVTGGCFTCPSCLTTTGCG